jgi:hypothetical protein
MILFTLLLGGQSENVISVRSYFVYINDLAVNPWMYGFVLGVDIV